MSGLLVFLVLVLKDTQSGYPVLQHTVPRQRGVSPDAILLVGGNLGTSANLNTNYSDTNTADSLLVIRDDSTNSRAILVV